MLDISKRVVLHFWASWCPLFRNEFQGLDAWNSEESDRQGIALVTLSGDGCNCCYKPDRVQNMGYLER